MCSRLKARAARQFWQRRSYDFKQPRSYDFKQRRSYDFNVGGEDERGGKLPSMHRDPVDRGLIEKPEHWQGFSFRIPPPAYWDACSPTLREKEAKDGAAGLLTKLLSKHGQR